MLKPCVNFSGGEKVCFRSKRSTLPVSDLVKACDSARRYYSQCRDNAVMPRVRCHEVSHFSFSVILIVVRGGGSYCGLPACLNPNKGFTYGNPILAVITGIIYNRAHLSSHGDVSESMTVRSY